MKRSLVCVLSVLALAVSAPVMAQSEQNASGTVVSSSSNQLVISTADGRQMTFMLDNSTNRPSSLRQGSQVTVRYHDMNGTFHAANVSDASSGSTAGNTNPDVNRNSTTSTTGTSSPTGTTGVTGSNAGTRSTTGTTTTSSTAAGTAGQAGSTATGTSATSANAQDRGTAADPTGNDARNTRTAAEDATGTTGTRDTGTATGTQRNLTGTSADRDAANTGLNAQQDTTRTTGARDTATGTTGAMDADQDTGTTRLPATASPLPLMGLSGLLALAGGLATRAIRRRK